jgi:protein-disulfide isomerase
VEGRQILPVLHLIRRQAGSPVPHPECPACSLPFHPRVKRLILACSLLACSNAFAVNVDPKIDRAVHDALPVCSDSKVSYDEMSFKLPARFNGTIVRVESQRPSCQGLYAAITSPTGGFYFGLPLTIGQQEGTTVEEKLKNFIWQNMQMNVTAVVDRKKTTDDGLYSVTLFEATENGKMPLDGLVDPQGTTFFFGHFSRLSSAIPSQRVKGFESQVASMPSRGPSSAPVTIIEFSDFECPSCRRAAHYVDSIIEKHAEKVRYVRFDLPLTMHPWAFPAALAGRAIHRQNPDAFWEYKKQIYANQDSLTAFTFGDFARGFAQDHQLDLKKYDADLQNEDLKNEILKSAGSALSNEVRATPTYLVNGTFVDAGDEGKNLAAYVDQLLAAK